MNEMLLLTGSALGIVSFFSYAGFYSVKRAHFEFLLIMGSGLFTVTHHSGFDSYQVAVLIFRLLFYIYWIHSFTKVSFSLPGVIFSWSFTAVSVAEDLLFIADSADSLRGTETLLLLAALYFRYSGELSDHRNSLVRAEKKIGILRRGIIREEKLIAVIRGRFEKRLSQLNEELIIAKDIQKGMIPSLSFTAGNVRAEGHYEYRESTGGDYFDQIITKEGDPCFIIGDVSGSGIPAGLVMTIAKLLFRKALAKTSEPSLIFSEVNEELYSILRFEQFMSAFLIIIRKDGSAVYANTGHPAPLLLRRKPVRHPPGEVFYSRYGLEELRTTGGLFLGSMPGVSRNYKQKNTQLYSGDRLILFTDGLLNQQNAAGQLFSAGYWESILISGMDTDPEEVRTSLIYSFNEHRGNIPLNDDTMFVLLEYIR